MGVQQAGDLSERDTFIWRNRHYRAGSGCRPHIYFCNVDIKAQVESETGC